MANRIVTTDEISSIANAIRAKFGTSDAMTWPLGFVNTIAGITEKAAATYNTSGSDQEIAADQYLTGKQTIKAVQTSNIDAGNIKAGVTVKVGDANSAGRIKDVTGTFTADATAAAGDIASGKTAYVNGEKITGNYEIKYRQISGSFEASEAATVENNGYYSMRCTFTPTPGKTPLDIFKKIAIKEVFDAQDYVNEYSIEPDITRWSSLYFVIIIKNTTGAAISINKGKHLASGALLQFY